LAVLLVAAGGIAVWLRRRPRETASAPLSAAERARLDALMGEASDRP
jgi:hypothetical protein